MTAPPRSTRPDYSARPYDSARPFSEQHLVRHSTNQTAANQTTANQTTDTLPAAADEQRFTLSVTQIMASVAAAVTAAMVGSTLGVAGTVIGAGLASVISVVGGAIFGHSILLTRKQVKRAVLQVRGADHQHADSPADLGF